MITAIDKNTALLLIDLQKGMLKRNTVHPIKEVLDKSALLVAAFRAAGLPVVVITVNPFGSAWLKTRKDQKAFPNGKIVQIVAKLLVSVTGFLDIADEIKTHPTDIFVTKKAWNAFYNTSLHDELQRRSITGIVLCGSSTSIGVEGTGRAASELGYNISFAKDAMTDSKADAHLNSINNILPRLGEVGTCSDILAKIAVRV